jgi:hypothetical protein
VNVIEERGDRGGESEKKMRGGREIGDMEEKREWSDKK